MTEKRKPMRIVYIRPSAEQIADYGRALCRELGDEFTQPEVVAGFINFLQLAAQIMARHLNDRGVDNAQD